MRDRFSDKEVKDKAKLSEKSQLENIKITNTELIHYLNYWVLGLWLVLRVLDHIFSYIVIKSGLGDELNPIINAIGFNFLSILIGFLPIVGLIIVNYKYGDRKDAIYFIFIGTSILIVIQVIATLNAIFVGYRAINLL